MPVRIGVGLLVMPSPGVPVSSWRPPIVGAGACGGVVPAPMTIALPAPTALLPAGSVTTIVEVTVPVRPDRSTS
ncbi:hypothetical protein AEGHOMDF_5821 [Methylobacterium soli]|nr:hypothetical protein AEGHOMDF_5821 [Methylobacterium soli]